MKDSDSTAMAMPPSPHPIHRHLPVPEPIVLVVAALIAIVISLVLTATIGGTDEWMKGQHAWIIPGTFVTLFAVYAACVLVNGWYDYRYARQMRRTGWMAYEAITPNLR